MFVRWKEDKYSQISIYINFLAVSMKIAMLQPVRKFSEKRLFSINPIKIPLLGYFFMQNSFLHFKRSQSLRFLRNMQKIEKKYLLSLFSIFCDFLFQFQAKFPKTKSIMFVRWKEVKYSQSSIYQFFGRQHENRHAIACSKILRKEAVFYK